ncbi:MAG: flagellar cap protein FliD N-terminal domain-containing protein, partial [Planctomycetota bacterium]
MSGIASTGLISGIDSASLIDQLIQIQSRPRLLAEQRVIQLQAQQAAYLDLNNALNGLESASNAFRLRNSFDRNTVTSTDEDALSATASIASRAGSFSVKVDRLVSTQQLLSGGFADRDTSPFGATSLTFEPEDARLEQDISLSELNGGLGIKRGRVSVTDDLGATVQVDLSRVGTVNELLDTINETAGLNVTARLTDSGFELVGATAVTDADGRG